MRPLNMEMYIVFALFCSAERDQRFPAGGQCLTIIKIKLRRAEMAEFITMCYRPLFHSIWALSVYKQTATSVARWLFSNERNACLIQFGLFCCGSVIALVNWHDLYPTGKPYGQIDVVLLLTRYARTAEVLFSDGCAFTADGEDRSPPGWCFVATDLRAASKDDAITFAPIYKFPKSYHQHNEALDKNELEKYYGVISRQWSQTKDKQSFL